MNGKIKHRRISRYHLFPKAKTLPPHSWEVHPRAFAGKANRTFVIVLIAVLIIILLGVLLFLGGKAVGKAYNSPTAENAVDIVLTNGNTVSITAQVTQSINGFYLELKSLTPGFNACEFGVASAAFGDDPTIPCVDGTLIIGGATLDDEFFLNGNVNLAQLTINTFPPGVSIVFGPVTQPDNAVATINIDSIANIVIFLFILYISFYYVFISPYIMFLLFLT